MMKIERPSHTSRMREAHRHALRVLFAQLSVAVGYEVTLIERTIDYHITRLHHLWFSTSRREKAI
jgi:hypothetical protein